VPENVPATLSVSSTGVARGNADVLGHLNGDASELQALTSHFAATAYNGLLVAKWSGPVAVPKFDEFSAVRLLRPVRGLGAMTYPAGTKAVIVHRHDDGIGYEIEFAKPKPGVATVTYRDIVPDGE